MTYRQALINSMATYGALPRLLKDSGNDEDDLFQDFMEKTLLNGAFASSPQGKLNKMVNEIKQNSKRSRQVKRLRKKLEEKKKKEAEA